MEHTVAFAPATETVRNRDSAKMWRIAVCATVALAAAAPAALPRSVSLLGHLAGRAPARPSGAADDAAGAASVSVVSVYCCGVAHVSSASCAHVRAAVRALRPDCVFLEVCARARENVLALASARFSPRL